MPLDQTRSASPARPLAALLLAAILPALGACQTGGDVTGSIYPQDYRDRHPIVLKDGARVLDVFVGGPSGLVSREREDVTNFLAEYRQFGNGALVVQVPAGAGTNPSTQRALATIRAAAGGRASVRSYEPGDPSVASPIRLTFRRLEAKVTSTCGLWPQDLGVSDTSFSSRNEQYWNFGCAYQANLAAQVADPVDLVRGRAETPPDTGRRMYNFGQIRQGQDPSTAYKQQDSSVKQGVGQ